MRAEEFRWRRGDTLAAAGVLLLALGILFLFIRNGYGDAAQKAEIYLHGEKIKEVDLAQDQSFSIHGRYTNEITVEGGRISVSHSDCPGKDCVYSGWKSRAGEGIVCLPNEVEIRILGDAEVDFVTGK